MKKRIPLLLLTLCLLLCGCGAKSVFAPEATSPVTEPVSPELFTVHFLDMGQADSILLECGGEFMLIDGGTSDTSKQLVSYLQSCGVQELKTVVSTHAHYDHSGGLSAVLKAFPVKSVYVVTTAYTSKTYDKFLAAIDKQHLQPVIPSPGDKLTLGSAEFTVLGPLKDYEDHNNDSIVLLAEFGDTRFLFAADAELEAEFDMLDYWEGRIDWDVDVLKAGHHGSASSSTYRFICETTPEYAIVSCGKDNEYFYPHDSVLYLYQYADILMLRTDELGSIHAVSDGTDITFTWENQHTAPADQLFGKFIADRKTFVLHTPYCLNVPDADNRIYYDSYEAGIEDGCNTCELCIR